jgi:predicted tellurium resistance membrane protein TerC
MATSVWFWVGFNAFVLAMLALDLGVFHRRAHTVRPREAAIWTGVWVSLALLFCLGLYLFQDGHTALLFLTGYLIEESLSVDNIFVIVLIFSYFRIPSQYQHRVLFWGILGADLVFAVDSIPAIFAVTTDPFIVYTSNVFAILGLRSLYFLLVNVVDRFHLLRYGLAIILTFVGTKMVIADVYKIPVLVSLLVIVGVLSMSIMLSLLFPKAARLDTQEIQGTTGSVFAGATQRAAKRRKQRV